MDNDTFNNKTVDTLLREMAQRVKARRLEKNLSQKAFAKRAGVGYDAYRNFENTGEATLRNVILCAIVLDEVEVLESLFTRKAYQSIDELLTQKEKEQRQRASKK